MGSEMLLYLLLGIILFDYLLDQSIDYLNLKNLKSELPDELKGVYNEEEYARSQNYQKTQSRFSFLTSFFSVTLTVTVIVLGGFGYLNDLLAPYFSNPIFLSLAFFGVIMVLSDLVNLPFQLYATFGIEAKFGFNKTTPKTFIMDKFKGYLVAGIIGFLLGYALLWLINELQENFWVYALLVIAVFILFMNVFYTSLILPLFNKLTPLEDGELKTRIQEYADKVRFPLDSVFVIDGSKRSTKANAFFSGLGRKKKVVLYDTLIEKQTEDELVAVLAHEVGHFKKKHIITGLVLSLFQLGVTLFIMSLLIFNENLTTALGGTGNLIHLNLIAFGLLYSPVTRVTGLLMNVMSRKNEFEADEYAAKTFRAGPLQSALKKLSVTSLSNLTPHPAYVFMNYSHPPLLKRLRALNKFN